MIRFYLATLLLIISTLSIAQGEFNVPASELARVPIAATPEAAALGKFGEIPVGLSTGIPNISVPFYQYQNPEKNLYFSVGINYHAGGHKVEDMASSTGLGWALNAGGMVSRTVNGLPDDGFNGYLSTDPLPNLYTTTPDYLHYFSYNAPSMPLSTGVTFDTDSSAFWLAKSIVQNQVDAEPDIFTFSAGDFSGKFVIRKNHSVQLFTQNNVAVNLINGDVGNGFTIIDKNTGVSYVFDVGELVHPASINMQTLYGNMLYNTPSSYIGNWHLSKIISADGKDTIKLHYVFSNTTTYEGGFGESVTAERQGPLFGTPLEMKGIQSSYMQLQNLKKRLQFVEIPDGTLLKFNNDFPRVDLMGDSALTSVEISNDGFTKKFNLHYDYFQSPYCPGPEGGCSVYGSPNDWYKRLRLLKVQQSSGADLLPPYLFEYNATALPTRKSNAQDHWGFSNGTIRLCRIPPFDFPGFPGIYGMLGCGDRDASEEYGKAWLLEKLTYPTGGHTRFYYEGNKAFGTNYNINRRDDQTSLSETMYDTYRSLDFTTRNHEDVKFRFKLYADTSSNGGPQVVLGCNFYYTISSTDNSFTTTFFETIEHLLAGYEVTLSLPLNKTYQIKFTSDCGTSLPPTYYTDIFYNYGITPIDKPIGGMRIAKMEDYSGVSTSPDMVTNYTYMGTDGHSSGEFQHAPHYGYYTSTTNIWTTDPSTGLPVAYPRFYIHRSSTPTQSLSYFMGSPVIYKRVKVDRTNNNVSNGYSVHEFTTFASTPVLAGDYPFVQSQDQEWKQGLPVSESVYTSADQLVRTVTNEYDYFDDYPQNNNTRGLKVGLLQDDNYNTMAHTVYGARSYYYMNGRNQLKKTKTRDYTGPSTYIENIVDYTYDPNKYLLTKQSSTNSKGETVEKRIYYPGNYNVTGLPYDVATYNGDAEVVSQEEWIKKGADWYMSGAVANNYAPFSTIVRKNKIIKAELTQPLLSSVVGAFNPSQLKRHASFEDQVEILQYDNLGRMTEMRSINDQKISFIWMPLEDKPIAQATNADAASIAHSSFEVSEKGGWTYSGAVSADATAPTGKNCYNMTGGNISKTGLASTTYIVSYWGKNGSILVNGSGPGFSGKVVGSWQYFEHEITGTSVTLSGNKFIDELRLYPKTATMVTTTYSPLLGITSQCDANNRIIYYSYDKFGRLSLVRDHDKNILKKICYGYAGQVVNCNP